MLCEEPVMCDVSAVPEATLMQDLAFWNLEKLGVPLLMWTQIRINTSHSADGKLKNWPK